MSNTDANSDESLEGLLKRLHEGDLSAAEAVFRIYEPYLRMVVRRQLSASLRPKFDSLDIVQSVWVDVLQGFREAGWRFPDPAHLRAFLIKATRNRFIDRMRQHRLALEKEEPGAAALLSDSRADPGETPTAQLHAQELWEKLLKECPPNHRDVLHLKRQGHSLAEIAERTNLHPGSVRRILYDLAARMTLGKENESK